MYSKNEPQNGRVEEYGEYILSRTVKSVHRTYFLDVRATKGEDLFVSITESRKRQNADGSQYYDRHKIVLYKEDIARFCQEFGIIENYLKEHKSHYFNQNGESVAAPAAPKYEEPMSVEPESEGLMQEESIIIESEVRFEDL